MSDGPARYVTAVLVLVLVGPGDIARAAGASPIRAVLLDAGQATPEALAAWKAGGGNAVVVPLDESVPRPLWAALAERAARAGLDLYPWVEVARSPALADAHPEWMAAVGGHHDDWRKRFPDAPATKPGEVIKAWPWVPIGYAPAFDGHRRRLARLLDGLPGRWAGVFLNDLQAGPSSCGCGNDQCRWALDYGSPPTAANTPGDDAAARLVSGVRDAHPGKAVVPVWVTECEDVDLPGAAGGTGFCGRVECAKTSCWPRYALSWNPLVTSTTGPLAVGLWTEAFRRDAGWEATALNLFRHPPCGGAEVPPGRVIAVIAGSADPARDRARAAALESQAGGGWVIARSRVDQSWVPRQVKVTR